MIENRLGSLLASKPNNFDLLRIVLASAVIASHAKVGIIPSHAAEAAGDWQGVQFLGLGRMAVNLFFSISGFLITKSWLQGRGGFDFGQKRVLRIYPGLIVHLLLTLLVFAPLGGGHLVSLLSDRNTLRFFSPLVLMGETQLPGVFQDSPYRGVVVGPMWSIRFEIICYLLTALLGTMAMLRRPKRVALLAVGVMIAFTLQLMLFPRVSLVIPFFGNMSEIPRLVTFYLIGASFYLFRDQIPLSPRLFFLSLVTLIATCRWIPSVSVPVLGTYILLSVAFARIPYVGGKFNNDISYGMYLYSFPVMQLLLSYHYDWFSSWGRLTGSVLLFAATLLSTCVVASASWWFVEKPCLRFKTPRGMARGPAIPAPVAMTGRSTGNVHAARIPEEPERTGLDRPDQGRVAR